MKIRPLTLITALLGALLIGRTANATPTIPGTPTAASLIAGAENEAASENKNVLLIFHSSLCGSCRELDEFLAMPEIQPIIGANYVTAHIVVWESGDKKDLNNPGGEGLLAQFGGGSIPYIVILNPRNDTLAISKDAKGQNYGFPTDDESISVFMKMLRSASHHLSHDDAELIYNELKKREEDDQQLDRLNAPISNAMDKHDYKAVVASCDQAISLLPDKDEWAYIWRFMALLHVDENKALSEMGQPMGTTPPTDADIQRAGLIVGETGLSDKAYHAALSVLLANEAKKPETDDMAYWRFAALLHVDENKALSEMGQPMGTTPPAEADIKRVWLIVGETGLSDKAYHAALSVLLANEAKKSGTWASAASIARVYAHINNMTKAIEYIDKAVDRAKAAKVPQGGIDYLVKLKSGWQRKG